MPTNEKTSTDSPIGQYEPCVQCGRLYQTHANEEHPFKRQNPHAPRRLAAAFADGDHEARVMMLAEDGSVGDVIAERLRRLEDVERLFAAHLRRHKNHNADCEACLVTMGREVVDTFGEETE